VATADQWHQRLGHIGPEALAHLPTSVTGAELIDGPSAIQCEVCSTSKARKVTSRRPASRAVTPFERIHLDLFQMTEGFNGDKWILHFLDNATRMNFVYTFPTKSLLTATIQQFTTFVRRRFGFDTKIFHSDNERTLGKRFDTWIKQEGYTFESSAPYTPEQNGAAERSGGMITTQDEEIQHHLSEFDSYEPGLFPLRPPTLAV
jgi:transposase InsO family protein